MTIKVYALDPRCHPDHVGLIPSFLDEADPSPAAEQFDKNYIGGWHHQDGFKLVNKCQLKYPGDPRLAPLAYIPFRQERIFIYQFGYVAIIQPDGSFEACRMD